jgi:hypothetical protein
MHFGHAVTIKALPTILKDLGNKGLTPVTLTDLLKPMKISPAQKVIKG